MRLSRRSTIGLLLVGAGVLAVAPLSFTEALAARRRKGSGKKSSGGAKASSSAAIGNEWHPERSPEGPVAIIVSLPKQRLYVYRNGVLIGSSSCSTGKKDFETPTGVFTILEKEEEHYSKTYDDAAMPMMERLTWDGVAIHAGNLPGYPASHGCVRIPRAFADKLYGVTQVGTPVIIADDATAPASVTDPGLLLGAKASEQIAKSGKSGKKTKPTYSTSNAVTTILVSRADKTIYVIQNGDIVAQGTPEIGDPGKPLGSNVFILEKGDENGFTWQGSGFSSGKGNAKKPSTTSIERVTPPADVQKAIDDRMKPGMVYVTTDKPASPDTRSDKNFVVMGTEEK